MLQVIFINDDTYFEQQSPRSAGHAMILLLETRIDNRRWSDHGSSCLHYCASVIVPTRTCPTWPMFFHEAMPSMPSMPSRGIIRREQ